MAFFDLIKTAGEKLFASKDSETAAASLAEKPDDGAAKAKSDALNRSAGDANKYPVIFEANKPMLKHPDKIYPCQVLRIPAL